MIGAYCRQYRIKHGVKLHELNEKVGTISAFEMGNSSNIKHLESYIKLSKKLDDTYNFMNGLTIEVLKHGC